MTMAITFSRQNYVGSHVRTTSYWEILVLVVKGLYQVLYHVYWQHRGNIRVIKGVSVTRDGTSAWFVIGPKWAASGVIEHSSVMRDLLFFTVNSVPNSVVSLTSPDPHTVIGCFPFCLNQPETSGIIKRTWNRLASPVFSLPICLALLLFPSSHQSSVRFRWGGGPEHFNFLNSMFPYQLFFTQ